MSSPRTTHRHEPGSVCWVGLATSDLAAAKAFYESLFFWDTNDLTAGEVGTYAALRRNGREVAILYRQTRAARAARVTPHWTPYISVEDADASALLAHELGGTLLREPHDLADAGRAAAVRDPVGGIVSLLQPRSHRGAEPTDDVGAACWHELVTPDVEQSNSFYSELLGWRYEGGPSGYTTAATSAATPVATIRAAGRGEGVTAAGWIPYFAVEGVDDAQRQAEQGGGRILTSAGSSPIGLSALLADPQGATFALLEQALSTRKESQVEELGHLAR